MAYLIFIISTIVLLGGFIGLVAYETQHSVRLFAHARTRLDLLITRIEFIRAHVDLKAFLREETSRIVQRVVHDAVHASLRAVRAIERLLTRLIRSLRAEQRTITAVPRGQVREFVRTLSDFKGHLETTRPNVPDIL